MCFFFFFFPNLINTGTRPDDDEQRTDGIRREAEIESSLLLAACVLISIFTSRADEKS